MGIGKNNFMLKKQIGEDMNDKVVHLMEIQADIALIKMEDRENKNLFTQQLMDELCNAFETAENNEKYKVIIFTGYDNYFATGGTKETLLAIQEGRMTFLTKEGGKNVYSLPLDCKIPVIAAMQGHAIGGGLSLGLFSDFIIMSRESVYSASFMKYGFTPGFGSTYIFPKKIGLPLAEEFLITARTFKGADLAKRGIPFEVYPRKEVLDRAIELAQILAEKPRISLITLKDNLVEKVRNELPAAIEKELLMHQITFRQPEVKEKIMNLY